MKNNNKSYANVQLSDFDFLVAQTTNYYFHLIIYANDRIYSSIFMITAILYKVMKEKGLHEDCIMQMNRLFRQKAGVDGVETDEDGRIRLDDWEMRKDVQEKVIKIWKNIKTKTIKKYADVEGFWMIFIICLGLISMEWIMIRMWIYFDSERISCL